MISIIITALNEGKVLSRTLEGIFSQTYTDVEVILVNDGSNDNTEEILRPYLNRIIYIKHKQNLRRQISRNEGIASSQGKYIFVCDADIVLRPDCLEKMMRALQEHPECSFAYSSFRWGWKIFKSYPFDVERLKKINYIQMASLVRREHHPGFDESIGKFQDWDVWLTMSLQGKRGYYIPEVLFSLGENLDRQIVPGLSKWFPKIMYKIPWHRFGIHIAHIEKYDHWKKIIQKKHNLLI